MINKTIYHLDRKIGDGLDSAVSLHHMRRLRKLGWERALDPPPGIWADGPPPPRQGNGIEALIDGEEAFPSIAEAIEKATDHVHISGWYLTPDFGLIRGREKLVLKELLEETARRIPVRVLMWAGAPIPATYPTTRIDVRRQARELCRGSRIHYAADPKERPMHCHHEKIVIADDKIAFVNGIEPTTSGGDRFDGQHHRMRGSRGWHDAGTRLKGPIAADVAEHFRMRWQEVAGERLARPQMPQAEGEVEAQLIRTIPERIYDSMPNGDFSILEAYTRGLRSAQRLIYLENQFLWSHHIVEILAGKLRNPPSDEFRLLVLLPSKPTTGMDDTLGQLSVLVENDVDDRFLACTLWSHSGSRMEQIYVHAKVAVVDDEWLTIGSANLNNHSLFNDTEVNIISCDKDLARSTRLRLWTEHLETSIDEVDGDPSTVIDEMWAPVAKRQLELRKAGRPITHRLVELPNVSKRSKRLLGPIQSFFVDG